VGFALSPLAEALLSLHVLLYPKVHALQHPWIRAMRRLSPALKREIRAFAFLYADAMPDAVLPARIGIRARFEEQLADVATIPLELLRYDLARPLFHWSEAQAGGPEQLESPETQGAMLALAADFAAESPPVARLIFDDPEELRRRFLDLLQRYWDEAFALEWDRLEPRLVAECEAAQARIDAGGLYELLRRLPSVRFDAEAGILVRNSPHEHEVDISAESPLMLVPSAYVWPHTRVNCDAPWPLTVVYPAVFARAELDQAPSDLVRTLRALGDATRLRALRLIAERPRSTEELAPLVGLSESGLSKHLRALVEAGLVTHRRQGWYVLYALDRAALADVPRLLATFVDGERPE
jgi:DNA-binding transcriptional ArsR family regulator